MQTLGPHSPKILNSMGLGGAGQGLAVHLFSKHLWVCRTTQDTFSGALTPLTEFSVPGLKKGVQVPCPHPPRWAQEEGLSFASASQQGLTAKQATWLL